ncbi:PP2C family protein-serine/threonine phosphatase [Streptomyces sp. 2A115]|uniref:PP2C family protein-serine/threonine phosphatase n=1 Tax=Streptomyces sp. 2A115 TaxID=3457439 RepID=UPI003FD62584
MAAAGQDAAVTHESQRHQYPMCGPTVIAAGPPLEPGQRTTSLVTQCLGGTLGYRAICPHVTAAVLSSGDRYLVCTDGLTDPLPTDVLDEVMREHDDGRAVFELWKAAITAGGPDNITLAVVRIGGE